MPAIRGALPRFVWVEFVGLSGRVQGAGGRVKRHSLMCMVQG